MKKVIIIGFLCVFFGALFSRNAYAEIQCRGTTTITYHDCNTFGFACYDSTAHTSSYSCGWNTVRGVTMCIGVAPVDNYCSGSFPNYVCSSSENWSGAGCSTCDDTVCKAGTTTYTQACGSTTRYYSCTNQCDGTNTWTTSNNSCRECQTENACGTTNWDCSATTCNECESCSPACGQTKDCGGVCANTDDGVPTIPLCGVPNGQEVTVMPTTINWTSGGTLTDYYDYRIDSGTAVSAGNNLSVAVNVGAGPHTWQVDAVNASCGVDHSGWTTPACSFCYETGPTLGAWSACNASTHKRTRTCTETCGTDDCTAAGAVGGVITQDCVGTIQGALFDASDMTTCPADLISNPGNYSGVLIANMSFNMTSPFGPPSWPGVNAATRTLTTNVNGFYTVNAYAPGTYTYDFSALAGTYIPVPRFNCTSAAAGLPGCSSADMSQPCATASLPNMSFGFWRIYGGWWQATGGNVYAKNGLGSAIPASVPAANQRLILSDSFGRSGMLSHGFAWAGTELGTNPNASVSTPLWRIQSTYNGLRYDFDYYQTRMDVFESTAWDGGAINYDDLGVGYQIFKHTGDVTLGYSGPTGTQKAVLLIDGNVTINNDITVPDGAFLGVVASGNITINPNVTTAQGWFVGRNINFPCSDDAAPLGTCDTDDVQFVGEGSFVGWTTINLDRDMGVGNNSAPSESFRYRPDMYLNVPDPMKVYTKRFTPFIP